MSETFTRADFRGKRRECGFCRFFHPIDLGDGGPPIDGECRVRSVDRFPRRLEDDWCGEWQLSKNGVWGNEQF